MKKMLLFLLLIALMLLSGCEEQPSRLDIEGIYAKSIIWGEETAQKPKVVFNRERNSPLFGMHVSWIDTEEHNYSIAIESYTGNTITGTYMDEELPITITVRYFAKAGLSLTFFGTGGGPLDTLIIKGLQPGIPE